MLEKYLWYTGCLEWDKYSIWKKLYTISLNGLCDWVWGYLDTHSYIQSIVPSLCRCQIACTPNPCLAGFACSVAGNSIHCERTTSPPYVEIAEICAGVLGLVLLVVAFVCFRKHYVSRKKHKSGCVQDSNGYFPTLPKSTMKEMEISFLWMSAPWLALQAIWTTVLSVHSKLENSWSSALRWALGPGLRVLWFAAWPPIYLLHPRPTLITTLLWKTTGSTTTKVRAWVVFIIFPASTGTSLHL